MEASLENLLSEFQKSLVKSDDDFDLIRRAFIFSQKSHQGQKRKSGEPYFNHAFETALKIAQWRLDSRAVAAALLHDIVEDAEIDVKNLKKEFGEEIVFLVEGVSKIGHLKYRTSEAKQAPHLRSTAMSKSLSLRQDQIKGNNKFEEMPNFSVGRGRKLSASKVTGQVDNLRKMILAISQDIRVVLIKLADRLHNMKTLNALPYNKQKRIALETYEIYAPLAYRLGMQNLSGELEDLAFSYLYPQEYQWLFKNIKEHYEERHQYLEKIKPIIEKALKENNIEPPKIDFRAKRYGSLYKKLLRYDMNLEQIYDLVALRIIVKTVEECYGVLGIIHQMWPPLPGKIKDYIALPKPNGYRSLHTTVFCLDNRPTEIQIRTMEMHEEAENGIAAHWAYEQGKGKQDYLERKPLFADKKELLWVEQLRNWQKYFSDPEEFIQSLKIDFFKDRIFAITPKGEVVDLPAGATPVDFAYQIHSQIGDQCTGAKVNNKIVSLDYSIQSGDMVEILLQKSKKPSESWLKFIKTNYAKRKIKLALRSSPFLVKKSPTQIEIKIVTEDRIGLLKDISTVISHCHIKITKVTMPQAGHFPLIIKIKCATNDKEKTEKLILKLKKIKGVKEINYKLV